MLIRTDHFIRKLCQENNWTEEYCKRVINEYIKFLSLAAVYPVAPSYEIDQVWHKHILYTQDYINTCNRIAGQYIHHEPVIPGGEVSRGKDPYIQTKEFYKGMFAEPPADIWTYFYDRDMMYVDAKRHWIIPLRDIRATLTILKRQIWAYLAGLRTSSLGKVHQQLPQEV